MADNLLNNMSFMPSNSNTVSSMPKPLTPQITQKLSTPASSVQKQATEPNVNQAILSDKVSFKRDLKLNARIDLDKGFKGYLSLEGKEETPSKQNISQEANLKNQNYIKSNQRNFNIPQRNNVAQSANNNAPSGHLESSNATTKRTFESTQKREDAQISRSFASENKMTETKRATVATFVAQDSDSPVNKNQTKAKTAYSKSFEKFRQTLNKNKPAEPQSTPTRGRDVPTRGGNVPTRGGEVPTRGGEVPTRGGDVPTRGGEVPTRGGEVPTRGGDVPTRGGEVPTRGGEVPTRGGNVPTRGGNVPTRGGEVPTRGGEVPTRGGEVPTRGGEVSTRGGNVPTRGGDVPTRGGEVPTRGGDVPTRGGEVPTRGGDVPTRGGDVPTRGGEVPTRGGEVPTRGGEVPTRGGEVPTRGGDVPTRGGEVPTRGGDVPTRGGEVPTRGGEVPTRGGEVPTRGGEVPTRGGNVPTRGGDVPTRGGNVPTRGGDVPTRGGEVPTRGGDVPTRGGDVPTRGGDVPTRGGEVRGKQIEPQQPPRSESNPTTVLRRVDLPKEGESHPTTVLRRVDLPKEGESHPTTVLRRVDLPKEGESHPTTVLRRVDLPKEGESHPTTVLRRVDQPKDNGSHPTTVLNRSDLAKSNIILGKPKLVEDTGLLKLHPTFLNNTKEGVRPSVSRPFIAKTVEPNFKFNNDYTEGSKSGRLSMPDSPKLKDISIPKRSENAKVGITGDSKGITGKTGLVDNNRNNVGVGKLGTPGNSAPKVPVNNTPPAPKPPVEIQPPPKAPVEDDLINNNLRNDLLKDNQKLNTNKPLTFSEMSKNVESKPEVQLEMKSESAVTAKLPKLESVVVGKNGIISTTSNKSGAVAENNASVADNKSFEFKSNSSIIKGQSSKGMLVIPSPKKVEEQVKSALSSGIVASNISTNSVEGSQGKKEDVAEEFEDWVGKDLAKSSGMSTRQKTFNELKAKLQQARERSHSQKVSNDNLHRETEKSKLPNEQVNANVAEHTQKANTLINKPQPQQEQNNDNLERERGRSESNRDNLDNASLGRNSGGNSSNNSNRNFMSFSQQQSLYNAESAKHQADTNSTTQQNSQSELNKTNQMSKQTNVMTSSNLSSTQQGQMGQGTNTNSSLMFAGKMTPEPNSQQARIDRDQALNSSQTSSVVLERQNSAKIAHAPTSMEATLKKSNKETWSGDEIAAKLIFMLMKASNENMYEHSSRVIDLSAELAQELGIRDPQFLMELKQGAMFHDFGELDLDLNSMPKELKDQLATMLETDEVKNAGFLHDIGKVYIPREILNKPGKLTDEEIEIVKQHPVIGEKMLSCIPGLAHVLPVVRHHHERWDGQGYPDKIGGEEIPYKARIISICDCFDALVSDRPYRQGMSLKEAMREIKAGAGTQFDPVITEVFLKMVKAKYSVS